jgi:hypothetical protein
MGANQNSSPEFGLYPKNQPETPLFYLGQDRIAIDKPSIFGTGLGPATKAQKGANKTTRKIDDKTRLKNSLSPLRHFTEHLVGVFEKLLRENNLDH